MDLSKKKKLFQADDSHHFLYYFLSMFQARTITSDIFITITTTMPPSVRVCGKTMLRFLKIANASKSKQTKEYLIQVNTTASNAMRILIYNCFIVLKSE